MCNQHRPKIQSESISCEWVHSALTHTKKKLWQDHSVMGHTWPSYLQIMYPGISFRSAEVVIRTKISFFPKMSLVFYSLKITKVCHQSPSSRCFMKLSAVSCGQGCVCVRTDVRIFRHVTRATAECGPSNWISNLSRVCTCWLRSHLRTQLSSRDQITFI